MKVTLLVGLLFFMDSFLYVMFSHCIFPPFMLFQHRPRVPALHNHSVVDYNLLHYCTLLSCTIQAITDDKSFQLGPKGIYVQLFL